jgi:hypothetical protein
MAYEPDYIGSDQNQHILMEMLHVALWDILPDNHLLHDNAKIRVFEQATGGLVASLSAWLLDGHKADVRKEYRDIEFPSSPWQFLKQLHAPKWFLNHWPVKTKTTTVEIAHHHHFVCPHVKVEDKNQHFMWMGTMSGQVFPCKEGTGGKI